MKKPITLMIDEDVIRAMRVWIAKQPAPSSQSATVEAALREFLKKHGKRKE